MACKGCPGRAGYTSTTTRLPLQWVKLGRALVHGLTPKEEGEGGGEATPLTSVAPSTFKTLVGRGHAEFSTNHQQVIWEGDVFMKIVGWLGSRGWTAVLDHRKGTVISGHLHWQYFPSWRIVAKVCMAFQRRHHSATASHLTVVCSTHCAHLMILLTPLNPPLNALHDTGR